MRAPTPTEAQLIERGQIAALERQMAFAVSPDDPTLARIHCARCGWCEQTGFDQRIAIYAAEPYGCPECREAAERKAELQNRTARAAMPTSSRKHRGRS